jgi:glutamate synthase domain-containing protein 2
MADCVDPAGAAGHLGSAAETACHLRNYPVMGHLRFIFEFIRPEIRQYFIEGDTEAQPFSRAQRSLVYQRAKGQVDNRPFGTQLDVSQQGYEWVNHSLQPTKLSSHDFRLWIGGTQEQPAEGWSPAPAPITPASSISRP